MCKGKRCEGREVVVRKELKNENIVMSQAQVHAGSEKENGRGRVVGVCSAGEEEAVVCR